MARAAPREGLEVHLDAPELGPFARIGTMYPNEKRANAAPAFSYDPAWLGNGTLFTLDPHLDMFVGDQHPRAGAALFGIFQDSAPDRWGRVLMERREAAQAEREKRTMRDLSDLDFLLGVSDTTRMGALRLRKAPDQPFLDDQKLAAPPVTSLSALAAVCLKLEEVGVERLPEYEQWLAMLIAPGTSLGGARPKANFTDQDGSLWLAKFPSAEDRYDIGAWELVVHELARRAGVWVPLSRLASFGKHRTFCVARFDREGQKRRMYASAMTLLEQQDGQGNASYLDIAQFIGDQGAGGHVQDDLQQLFRRLVFNILVGNRDDHLRNHGFIALQTGWHLAPAFDMNPSPHKATHALTVDGNTDQPSLAAAVATAELYRLNAAQAKAIVDEVMAVVATWKYVAAHEGLGRLEEQRMERVFQA